MDAGMPLSKAGTCADVAFGWAPLIAPRPLRLHFLRPPALVSGKPPGARALAPATSDDDGNSPGRGA